MAKLSSLTTTVACAEVMSVSINQSIHLSSQKVSVDGAVAAAIAIPSGRFIDR